MVGGAPATGERPAARRPLLRRPPCARSCGSPSLPAGLQPYPQLPGSSGSSLSRSMEARYEPASVAAVDSGANASMRGKKPSTMAAIQFAVPPWTPAELAGRPEERHDRDTPEQCGRDQVPPTGESVELDVHIAQHALGGTVAVQVFRAAMREYPVGNTQHVVRQFAVQLVLYGLATSDTALSSPIRTQAARVPPPRATRAAWRVRTTARRTPAPQRRQR